MSKVEAVMKNVIKNVVHFVLRIDTKKTSVYDSVEATGCPFLAENAEQYGTVDEKTGIYTLRTTPVKKKESRYN